MKRFWGGLVKAYESDKFYITFLVVVLVAVLVLIAARHA